MAETTGTAGSTGPVDPADQAADQAAGADQADMPIVTWLDPEAAAGVLAMYMRAVFQDATGSLKTPTFSRQLITLLAQQSYHLVCCDNPPNL